MSRPTCFEILPYSSSFAMTKPKCSTVSSRHLLTVE